MDSMLLLLRSLVSRLKIFQLDSVASLKINDSTEDSAAADLSAWHRNLSTHGQYWWQRHGYALAILLAKSSYSHSAQVQILEFFICSLVPWLGGVDESGVERWKSFMTDDYNPIELSWDWSTACKPPTIRLSLEPISEHAGTAKDPNNDHASEDFLDAILKVSPDRNMQWFHHFDAYFNHGVGNPEGLSHGSKIFWAFNLVEDDLAGKVYFSPLRRGISTDKTNLEVISEAIEAAPTCTPEGLTALYLFQDYVNEQKTKSALEVEALAIDLVDPSQSRLKIYFRSRETSFQSVRNIMSLGGRLINKHTEEHAEKGLQNLRRLWDSLFDQYGVPDEAPLSESRHETAGILYYVDFHVGGKMPKVKIYLPVRHYAANDWQVVKARDDTLAFCEAMSQIL
ncbi:aromatic prenyltransferase [Mariannaea sp. PMI_226]|nr:aromatic prenyltransferase [Mariannaea sp. PMI_226]